MDCANGSHLVITLLHDTFNSSIFVHRDKLLSVIPYDELDIYNLRSDLRNGAHVVTWRL